uniref:Malonyl-CoA decarboxylase C-terminal domain-containing protein n=1 Tax=Rhizophora mucronata TaxID=61149 RepID=A0A2P2LMQ3_RHIMU
MIERMNWMADRSEKGLHQSGGIMVNYVYRVENIEEYAQLYFSTGHIHASSDVQCYLMPQTEQEMTAD